MKSIKVRLVLGGLFFGAAAVVLLLPQAGFSHPHDAADVELTYDSAAGTCTVNPESVMIYVNQQPTKVRWVSKSGDNYYWDIIWKGGAEPNYFNRNFDIRCGHEDRTSNVPSGKVKPGDKWPYSVVVHACTDTGRKGDTLCVADPEVDWGP